ncbi:glycosyltransferase family 2 protein [Falsibacillus pallidus]|uniref:glycosyltransferase family 2 protein n=1 Tax=Falsibacillus pallidus TaxID=493781 RepID=UPI003D990138
MMISVVVPCFNEELGLKAFYKNITEVLAYEGYRYEIILVNDGSKDLTKDIIIDLAHDDAHVKYISFSRNFGKEAAMLAGLRYASGDVMIIIDADLQHPPSLIPEMVLGYEKGYDQVIAKRNRQGEAPLRKYYSQSFYKFINYFVDVKLENGAGDFRLLSRKAVDSLLELNEYNRFSKGLFSWIGFKEYIIHYDNVLREHGESKWSFSKLLNYGIDGIISFNNKPLRLAIYLGLMITSLSVIYIFAMLIRIFLYGIDVPGYFTTISAVLFLGGIQLTFMGMIGEYIGRIYYETKQRPHYIIEELNIEKAHIQKKEKANLYR